jgi:hypothetical protein
LNYPGCPVGPWELNIELPIGRSILNCGGCPVGSWELNIELPRVPGGLIGV